MSNSEENKQIFISYSHHDKAFTQKLASYLRENHFNIWLDEQKIGTSDILSKEIGDALESSVALIAVISKSYKESDYCNREFTAMQEDKKLIFPVRLDDTRFFQISGMLYTDCTNPSKHNDAFATLRDDIRKKLKLSPPPEVADFLLPYKYPAWGKAITIVSPPKIGTGWLMSEIAMKLDKIEFVPAEAEVQKSYQKYFENNYESKGFVRDNERYMLITRPTVFSDDPDLNLMVCQTRYSMTKYYSEQIASKPNLRDPLIKQLYSDPEGKINFAHSFCMHAIITTSDNKILLTQRVASVGYYPNRWQCTISEQLAEEDFESATPMLAWAKRMLDEEMALDHTHYSEDKFKILSVFLEGDLLNVAVCAYIQLDITSSTLQDILSKKLRKDYEFKDWKFYEISEIVELLVSKDVNYHPTSQYIMYMALLHSA